MLGRQRTSVGYRVVEREAKTDAGEERIVWLDAMTLDVLKAWRRQTNQRSAELDSGHHDDGYVFTHEDGGPLHPDYVTKAVARTMRRHGPAGARLHGLRQFRASALISTGVGIAAVPEAMGHRAIATTSDLYANLLDTAGRGMAERAAGIVPRQRRPDSQP